MFTSDNALILAAAIRASALAFVKYKFVTSGMSAVLTCPPPVPKSIIVSVIESAAGVNEMLVICEPSTAGIFAEPSNCKILFAVVPTSTFSVCV